MEKSNKISFLIREISGSLGDLPLFFIFIVGLSQFSHLNPLSILFWSGVAHIFAGVIFKIPLPFQPMKAMGLYAMAHGISQAELLTAGIGTGILILTINGAGLFQKLYKIFPEPVIRGIQLGLAFSLLKKAYQLIMLNEPMMGSYVILGILGVIGISLFFRKEHIIVFFVLGIGISILYGRGILSFPVFQFSQSFFETHFSSLTWTESVLTLMILQLPLTVANSIFSPALLIKDYFPQKKIKASHIAASVGLINLLTCPFGGMPACHGAGGLAAQYQFGARSGFSIIFLGVLKILSALFAGTFFLTLAQFFPKNLLGILFIFPAFDLCYRALSMRGMIPAGISLATALSYIGWGPGWSMISGCVVFYGIQYFLTQEKINEISGWFSKTY